jgi:hypothetical protein
LQYIALIHGNAVTPPTADEWERFFDVAQRSGLFRGGSAIGNAVRIGAPEPLSSADAIVGFMRFDADALGELHELLAVHPVICNGGSIDLCEMPRS